MTTTSPKGIAWERVCAGHYRATATSGRENLVASVVRLTHLPYRYGQWVARAEWRRDTYTDPILYLRDAKDNAIRMLQDAMSGDDPPELTDLV